MKRALRFVGYGLGGVAVLVAGGLGYLYLAFPVMGQPAQGAFASDAKQLERGTYLAEHVAACVDCHSERDWTRFSGPPKPGTFGQGGERFGHDMGLPGELYAGNITPHHVGGWSDGELARAITDGVTPDGRALFPLMNYPAFSKLCRKDVEALVSYVRALKPVANEVPETKLDFPLNLIVRTMPAEAKLGEACPDGQDSVAQGAYLVNAAGCADCHSRRKGNEVDPSTVFAGGVPFDLPNGSKVVSKNITPDASGIGSWSREAFVKRFSSYRDPQSLHEVHDASDAQTIMPWALYAGMTDADLGAIYDFLRTVRPVKTATGPLATR